MKKNSRIYIAGHGGLIGSAIQRELKAKGYKNIITMTYRELDLTDRKRTEFFFKKEKPEYIFLAAAKSGGIYANNTFPAEFIYQNLMIQTNVIDISYKYGVKKLLFLVSSCTYPKICKQPMKEDYILSGPLESTNEPFAIAKLAGIKMCQAYNRQYGTDFISAIPSSIYGINDHFGENAHVLGSCIKKFHKTKIKGEKTVTIWGSGKPKRDFLYADDLATACLFLMKNYNSSQVINIGSGVAISIRELAGLIKDITGFRGKIFYDKSRPDGNSKRILDSSRIRRLGWKPQIPLEEGIKLTYVWYKKLAREKR